MARIDLPLLISASTAGGPSALSTVTPLAPASGPQAAVAPAKYVRGRQSAYLYDTRFVGGEALRTVLLDSSQSQSNRAEQALNAAILDEHPVLGRIPRVRVTYEVDGLVEQYTDLTLPHRVFDAHIRSGSVDGAPTTDHPVYRAARDATPANARALLDLSPVSLVFGSWDASRKARQGRWPSAITGEVVGVLADQRTSGYEDPVKGGARVDPVGMRAQVDGKTLRALAEAQRAELSTKKFGEIVSDADKAKGGTTSASALGFGGIPPTLEQLGGVSCRQITRAQVLSFATLRQIRFGAGASGDAALRAVLAAIAINALVRSNAELYLRAHCHLTEAGRATTVIDRRNGEHEALELPTIDEADDLLATALEAASREAGLDWHGQVFEVTGNPAIVAGREDDSTENQ